MAKTVTLRLDNDVYRLFSRRAQSERRALANYIEIATLEYTQESAFVEDSEMDGILSNKPLIKRLKEGSAQAKKMKGHFVG